MRYNKIRFMLTDFVDKKLIMFYFFIPESLFLL